MNSVAQLFSCIPPTESDYETAFGGSEVRCQCAEVAGELFLEYVDSLGVTQTVSQSSVADAKEIQTASVSGTDAECSWTTVDGLANYVYTAYPKRNSSLAAGGDLFTIHTDIGTYTARVGGDVQTLIAYVCTNTNQLYSAISIQSSAGAWYGPFAPSDS